MFKNIFSKVLDINQRELDRLSKTVERINDLEKEVKKYKNSDFPKKTEELKEEVKKSESPEKTLNEILPLAFALVREAANREISQRAYDVQIMASIALFQGKIVEQKTGEGKTLSAVPALYLRALMGKGVHLVTVNDYLARRDAGWMAPIFKRLGLSTGVIAQEMKSYVYDPEYLDTS